MNGLAALAYACAAASLAAGLAMLVRERRGAAPMHFALAAATALLQLSIGRMLSATDAVAAESWAKAGMLGLVVYAPLLQSLGCRLAGFRRHPRWAEFLAWGAAGVLAALLHSHWAVARMVEHPWGWYPVYGPAGIALIVMLWASVLPCLRWLGRIAKRAIPGTSSTRRARLLQASLLVSGLASLDFLPVLELPGVPVFHASLTIALVMVTVTAWRLGLAELEPVLAIEEYFEHGGTGVLVLDVDGVVRMANEAAARLLDVPLLNLRHRRPDPAVARVIHGEDRPPAFPPGNVSGAQRLFLANDGTRRFLNVSISLVSAPGRASRLAVVALHDVTPIVAAKEQINRLAHYDPLTNLPNRLLLKERFGRAIGAADRAGAMAAVLFLDLDRFKQVNDSLGHEAGDQLLRAVAGRIGTCIRNSDELVRHASGDAGSTVARLGGDEFVVLVSPVDGAGGVATVCRRILAEMERPFALPGGTEVNSGTSIGVALYPGDGRDADTLLRHADTAMYHAKAGGRRTFEFFDEQMNRVARARVALETRVREAFADGSLALRYEPVVSLGEGRVVALDAQPRWTDEKDPRHEQALLGVVESTPLAEPFANWLLGAVLHDLHTIAVNGLENVSVMLALPAVLLERADFVETLCARLREGGIAPSRLLLRVGSGAPVSRRADAALDALRALGAGLVLDDFGHGRMPILELRERPFTIARIHAASLASGESGGTVARALIELAEGLGLDVAYTGVTSDADALLLHVTGCRLLQGPLFGGALPVDAVVDAVRAVARRMDSRDEALAQ
jgi:diguanylate cyclase (GGDEF)-like protein